MRARRVLSYSAEEAESLQHSEIDSGHLLLGLLREEGGVAGRVARNLGLDLTRTRELVNHLTPAASTSGSVELSSDTKKVLELAVDEARRMGHHYIGTEHLLLGLARLPEGVSDETLRRLGVSPADIRRETRRVLQDAPKKMQDAEQVGLEKIETAPLVQTAQEKDSPFAFISYARADEDFVYQLAQRLKAQQVNIWLDLMELKVGHDWWDEIEKHIIQCSVFIIVMSPGSKQSRWVKRELLLAEQKNKPIFPVLLNGEGWSRLADTQYEDMTDGIESPLRPQFINRIMHHFR